MFRVIDYERQGELRDLRGEGSKMSDSCYVTNVRPVKIIFWERDSFNAGRDCIRITKTAYKPEEETYIKGASIQYIVRLTDGTREGVFRFIDYESQRELHGLRRGSVEQWQFLC